MSDRLHFIRLRWHDGGGIARLHDVTVALDTPPDLGDGPVSELDFAPYLRCWQIRQHAHSEMAEMTRDQVRAARALVVRLCEGQG